MARGSGGGRGVCTGRREGGGTSQEGRPRVPTPHAAPASPQVVAIDLDEGLNGLVSYRIQVGMPRMDFLINSSSGVVVTTAELDRERIAEYQLRVVASDAGTPTKSSTGTLTVRGEGGAASYCVSSTLGPGAVPGRVGSPRTPLLSPPVWAQDALLVGALLDRATQHRVFPIATKSNAPAGCSLSPPGGHCTPRGLDPLPGSPTPPSLLEPSKEQRGAA